MKNIKYLSIKIIYLVFKIKKINDFKFTNAILNKAGLIHEIDFVYKSNNALRIYIKDNKLDYYACYSGIRTIDGITSYGIIALKNIDLKYCKDHDKINKILLFLKRFILLLKNKNE